MSSRTTRWLIVAVPVLIIAVIGTFAYSVIAKAQRSAGSYRSATPDLGTAPSYTLTNQLGRQVSSTQFAGKVQVVTYLFPYCTTYCPTITHTLLALEADLQQAGLAGGKVEIVAINVDPAGSGVPDMHQFLQQYGVDPANPTWQFLTGSPAETDRIVRGGYHVYFSRVSLAEEQKQIAREKADGTYTKVPEQPNPLATARHVGYDIVHNDYIEIVGPDGHIQQIYSEGNTVTETDLFAAVRKIAVPNG